MLPWTGGRRDTYPGGKVWGDGCLLQNADMGAVSKQWNYCLQAQHAHNITVSLSHMDLVVAEVLASVAQFQQH